MELKSQNWWPFFLGLFCGGTIVAFALGTSMASSEVPKPIVAGGKLTPQGVVQIASEADKLPQATHVPRPKADRVSIDAEEKPELIGALEQLHVQIPTDEQLEKRYANYSLIEMNGAARGLSRVVHEESTAFLEKKMERGLYTTQILPMGVEYERAGSFPDGAPRSTREVWHTRDDGFAEVWIAEIHPKEQPLLEARHKEIAWLRKRVSTLEKAKKRAEQGL